MTSKLNAKCIVDSNSESAIDSFDTNISIWLKTLADNFYIENSRSNIGCKHLSMINFFCESMAASDFCDDRKPTRIP